MQNVRINFASGMTSIEGIIDDAKAEAFEQDLASPGANDLISIEFDAAEYLFRRSDILNIVITPQRPNPMEAPHRRVSGANASIKLTYARAGGERFTNPGFSLPEGQVTPNSGE